MDISDFLQIEEKYDLYHQEVLGVQPWQYFRMSFWNYQICSDLLGLSNSIVKQKKWKQMYTISTNALKLLFKRKAVKKADIIFFAHERRVWNGKFFECIYTDELAQYYPDSIVLERPYGGKHLTPTHINNQCYTDFIGMKGDVHYLFHSKIKSAKYKDIRDQIEKIFQNPLIEICQKYQITLEFSQIYEHLTQIVLSNIIMRREYERIINKVSPRIIVEVVYYSRHCMVLNEIARQKGIPTIELQHGTMHSAHAAYQFSSKSGKIKQFPDYVYVFSEYWKKCAHLPIPDDHIIVTGYPYFERQLNQYMSNHIKEEIINIVFVSQGTIGRELSRLAADLSDLLDENKYHIIYKLHPGEYAGWRDRMPWLLKKNIEVIDNLEHNIYEYFAKSSIQVGVYSTAIYEGLGFGLRTFIYNIGHADTMAELCEQGYATCVSSVKELFENIFSADSRIGQDGKAFWKMNSFENICHEIDQFLMREGKEDIS